MPSRTRQRVTVDLRGIGERLNAFAACRAISGASAVRSAVLQMLEGEPIEAPDLGVALRSGRCIKVTLRLPQSHAGLLSERSRAACISMGDYVASLLDRHTPPPVPPDHQLVVRALHASSDRLAVLLAELRFFERKAAAGIAVQRGQSRSPLDELVLEVRQHLRVASQLLNELRPLKRPPPATASDAPSRQA